MPPGKCHPPLSPLAVELIIGTRAGFVISLLFLAAWLAFICGTFVRPSASFQIVKVFSSAFLAGLVWFGLVCFGLVGWWGANYFAVFMDALYLVNDFDVDNFNRKQSGGESMR